MDVRLLIGILIISRIRAACKGTMMQTEAWTISMTQFCCMRVHVLGGILVMARISSSFLERDAE